MTRQWTVKVDGNNVKTLHDGESVEIGRKPLRPLSDDGFARLDIMDPGKSMSKRHAVLSVDKQGNCSVRDLHSTNGSFVVTNNGQLMRLPAGEDIKLPIDSMTLQFGDVRLTLESAFEHDDEDDDATSGVSDDTSQPVSNLFEYAVSDEAPQEPDAADMSVDDILNLRAGEPTTFFHARNVTDRADALHQAERQTFTPEHADKPELEDAFPSVSLVQETVVAADKPRDLFADAAAQAEAEAEIEADAADSADAAATDAEVAAVSTETAAQPLEASHDGNKNNLIPVDKLFSARPSTPIAVALPDRNDTGDNTGNVDKADNAADASAQEQTQSAEQSQMAEQPTSETAEQQPAPDETAAFKPIFEPGSVFDRVSKGGLAKQEQTIEVDGLTSDDAKRTDDFTVQFQMARHPELLPFLAMNPSLYDDLYAWLGALGNQDIDAALAHNPGYEEYRKAVGK